MSGYSGTWASPNSSVCEHGVSWFAPQGCPKCINEHHERDHESIATLTAQRDEALAQLAQKKREHEWFVDELDKLVPVEIDGDEGAEQLIVNWAQGLTASFTSAQERAEKAEALLTKEKLDELIAGLGSNSWGAKDNAELLRDAILREAGK